MTEKKRNPLKLRDLRGIDPQVLAALARCGIKTAEQMLQAGCTPAGRAALAQEMGILLLSLPFAS